MLTLKKHSTAELFLLHSKYKMKSTDIILLVFPQGHRLSHAKLLILEQILTATIIENVWRTDC